MLKIEYHGVRHKNPSFSSYLPELYELIIKVMDLIEVKQNRVELGCKPQLADSSLLLNSMKEHLDINLGFGIHCLELTWTSVMSKIFVVNLAVSEIKENTSCWTCQRWFFSPKLWQHLLVAFQIKEGRTPGFLFFALTLAGPSIYLSYCCNIPAMI